MPKHNKKRGKYFESKIADIIRREFEAHKDHVHRNADSGNADFEYGDIFVKDREWIIECKYWSNINYSRLLTDWENLTKDFFAQVDKDADTFRKKHNKEPLVTVVIASPYVEPIATMRLQNFYNNDMFKTDKKVWELFKVFAINKELLIVNFQELVKVLKEVSS